MNVYIISFICLFLLGVNDYCFSQEKIIKVNGEEFRSKRPSFYLKTPHQGPEVTHIGFKNGEIKLGSRDTATQFELIEKDGKQYLYLPELNSFLSCPEDGTKCRLADRPLAWEEFEVTHHSEDGRVSLKTFHQTFVSACPWNAVLFQKKENSHWERYYIDEVVRARPPFYLKTYSGNEYIGRKGINVDRLIPTSREFATKFEIIKKEGRHYLYLPEHRAFLSFNEDKQTCKLAQSPNSWEEVEILSNEEDKTLSFKTIHGTYLSIDQSQRILTQSEHCSHDEKFSMNETARIQAQFYLRTSHRHPETEGYRYTSVINNNLQTEGRDLAAIVEILKIENRFYLFLPEFNQFMNINDDGSCTLSTDIKDSKEISIIHHYEEGTISIKTRHNTFLSAKPDGGVTQKPYTSSYERFTIDPIIRLEGPFCLKSMGNNYVTLQERRLRLARNHNDCALFDLLTWDNRLFLYNRDYRKMINFSLAKEIGFSRRVSAQTELQVISSNLEDVFALKDMSGQYLQANSILKRVHKTPDFGESELFKIDRKIPRKPRDLSLSAMYRSSIRKTVGNYPLIDDISEKEIVIEEGSRKYYFVVSDSKSCDKNCLMRDEQDNMRKCCYDHFTSFMQESKPNR